LSDMEIPEGCDVIDCGGMTVAPGLIDSHCHVVLGDYAPRQQQIGFLDSEVHGGVTTFISAGEVHLAGRPKDPAGTKALAILAPKPLTTSVPAAQSDRRRPDSRKRVDPGRF
jgi:enamidase